MSDIPPEQLAKWKMEYGEVFSVEDEYIFRPLKVKEHAEIERHKEWSSPEIEDYIVATALIHPQFSDVELTATAGTISSLAHEILNISGYGKANYAQKTIDNARERVNEAINLMKIFIIAAMPAYTDISLDDFTYAELAMKVALAEKIIEVRQGGATLALIDPEAEIEKEKLLAEKESIMKMPGQAPRNDPIAQKLRNTFGG